MVESKEITDSIKEASKSTIKTILEGVVKDYIREAADDENDEEEYEVVDVEKKDDANAESEKEDKALKRIVIEAGIEMLVFILAASFLFR